MFDLKKLEYNIPLYALAITMNYTCKFIIDRYIDQFI